MSRQSENLARFENFAQLLTALDNVPPERRETAITAATEYIQEIRTLQAAGASRGEIEAAGDAIYAKYR